MLARDFVDDLRHGAQSLLNISCAAGRRFDATIEQEGHLSLDLRLEHPPGGGGLALRNDDVGEQNAEVGPIDAKLRLR